MDLLRQRRIIALGRQPLLAGVILHRMELGVGMVDPDLQLPQFGELLLGHQDGDPLQMIGQHLERLRPLLLVRTADQLRVGVHGPTFHLQLHGLDPAHLLPGRLDGGLLRALVRGQGAGREKNRQQQAGQAECMPGSEH